MTHSHNVVVWATALALSGLLITDRPALAAESSYTFTTLAGSLGSAGSADGTGTAAQFNRPIALAVDGAGNVYVVEGASFRLRKITPEGAVTTLPGSFNYPAGVAIDGNGTLYVANTSEQSIDTVSAAGVVTALAGGGRAPGYADGTGSAAKFNYPYGVAVDGLGNAYVADTFNNVIRKITSAGVVSTLAGQAPQPGFLDGTGGEARFNNPLALAADAGGTVFVADFLNQTIRKITPAGVVTTLAGKAPLSGGADGTGADARFDSPYGIAIDSQGNLFVAEEFNHTVRQVTAAGEVTTIGGLAKSPGSADGAGNVARFNRPAGIAVDSQGNIYVADQFNHLVRKGVPAAPPPVITLTAPRVGVTAGLVELTVEAPSGRTVILQGSVDLVQWQPLRTNTVSGVWAVSESVGAGSGSRFYRAVSP